MFHNLHIYTVHTRPGKRVEQDLPLFVREGFNMLAFIFTFFWTLYQRLWVASAVLIAVNIVVAVLWQEGWLNEITSNVLMVGVMFICGFHANDWKREGLKRRGYITAGIVSGETKLKAEQRFFDRYVATQQVA